MPSLKHHKNRIFLISGLLLLISLFFTNFILSHIGKYYINETLENNLESYVGRINNLEVNIFKGSYSIEQLILYKKGAKERPLLFLENLRSTINIDHLFSHGIGLSLYLKGVNINIIDKKGEKKDQVGYQEESNEHWSKIFNTIIPLSINNLETQKAKIIFWYPNSKQEPLFVTFETIKSSDILNPSGYKNHQSPVNATGAINDSTNFNFIGSIDFTKASYPHELSFKLNKFKLNSLNDILLNYIPVDITRGHLKSILK